MQRLLLGTWSFSRESFHLIFIIHLVLRINPMVYLLNHNMLHGRMSLTINPIYFTKIHLASWVRKHLTSCPHVSIRINWVQNPFNLESSLCEKRFHIIFIIFSWEYSLNQHNNIIIIITGTSLSKVLLKHLHRLHKTCIILKPFPFKVKDHITSTHV